MRALIRTLRLARCAVLLTAFAVSPTVAAYIGPGAGISVVGSLLNTLLVILLAIVAVLAWPVRYLWRRFRRPANVDRGTPD